MCVSCKHSSHSTRTPPFPVEPASKVAPRAFSRRTNCRRGWSCSWNTFLSSDAPVKQRKSGEHDLKNLGRNLSLLFQALATKAEESSRANLARDIRPDTESTCKTRASKLQGSAKGQS